MSISRRNLARAGVVGATGLIAVLAGTLVAAVVGGLGSAAANPRTAPPPATVPAPVPCDLATLELPCWGCLWAEKWPVRYRTDLDMLAPVGTGTANAATWFADFAKPNGSRFSEAEAAMARRVPHGPVLPLAPQGFDVLAPDDPLLREAEAWCDQATMRFYPSVFAVRGGQTQLPNNLLTLTLARSWIARGHDAARFEDAMADFRRVIRLGRLLRQDDVVVIDDLLGLTYVRWAAEQIYDRARRDGKTELALLAAVVAGEGASQRHLTAARITAVEVAPYLRESGHGSFEVRVPPERLKEIQDVAASCPDRRFRNEAIYSLRFVAASDEGENRAGARALLEKLASDSDPIVAANARSSLAVPVTEAELKQLAGTPHYQ